MAMLAEPRRKVRYMVNPTGRDWAAQQGGPNHFGQRMMRTMGWREGQGLGRDNQGAAEPIHVKRKSDQRGVGCSSAYAAETMPQSVDFSTLLSQLNADHGGDPSASTASNSSGLQAKTSVSLEAKSKSSKARVHYHKFTRGKDVSAYDSHSLACIFGSRAPGAQNSMGQPAVVSDASAAAAVVEKEEDRDNEDPSDSAFTAAGFGFQQARMSHSQSASCLTTSDPQDAAETDAEVGRHGLQLVRSQTSLQDYFREKMRELQERRLRQQQQQEQQPNKDQTEEEEDKASWTSESSCSVASSAALSTRKRARFTTDLPDALLDDGLLEPSDSKSVQAAAVSDDDDEADNAVVIDFRLFPGSDFHLVLGYPLY